MKNVYFRLIAEHGEHGEGCGVEVSDNNSGKCTNHMIASTFSSITHAMVKLLTERGNLSIDEARLCLTMAFIAGAEEMAEGIMEEEETP